MKKTVRFLAVFLTLCILTQIIPLTEFGAVILKAAAYAKAGVISVTDMEWVFSEDGEEKTEDGWFYRFLPEWNYAVVTGHGDPAASSLSVPVTLGGADVVGLAAGAFADHALLESLSLPGNLRAVGDNAVPKGTVIGGYNGSYAQKWAGDHRYAFNNLSEFDFVNGVVDFADISPDAFERISQYEVRLRVLEAERLREGTTFFLLDPSAPYRISYYKAERISGADQYGFVTVACTTPEAGELLNSYFVEDAVLVADPSTIEAAEGVEIHSVNNRDQSAEASYNVFDFSFSKDLNEYVSISAGIQMQLSGKASASVKDSKTSTNVIVTMKGKLDFKIEASTGNKQKGEKDAKERLDLLRDFAASAKKRKEPAGYSSTVGKFILFSYAGILNIEVFFGPYVEVDGSLEASVTLSQTFVISKKENGLQTIEGVDEKKAVDAQIQMTGELKAGIMLTLEANVAELLTLVSVSVFAGLQGSASAALGNAIPVDMLDAIIIEPKVIIEARIGFLGVKKISLKSDWEFTPVKQLFGLDFVLFEKEFLTCHFHIMATDDAGNDKDRVHWAEDCPYEKLSVSFELPFLPKTDGNYYWPASLRNPSGNTLDGRKLEAFDVIVKPDDPDLSSYGMEFEGWYMDTAYTEPVVWPYTVINRNITFYGKAVSQYIARYYTADGKEIGEPTVCGKGKTFSLPGNIDDYDIAGWFLLPDSTTEKPENAVYESAGSLQVMPDHNISYLAACRNDIKAFFFIDGDPVLKELSLTMTDGMLTAPFVGDISHYSFSGWKDINGKNVVFPLALKPGDGRYQYFYAVWEYDNIPTDPAGPALSISGNGTDYGGTPQSGQNYFSFSSFDDTAMTCSVTGYKSQQTRQYYDNEGKLQTETYTVYPENIIVPSVYRKTDSEGNVVSYDVISVSGLGGWSTMVSASLPSTVRTLGSNCFANSPKLYSISIGGNSLTSIPSGFASNCPNLSEVSVPSSVTVIGSGAFSNNTSITEVSTGAAVGGSAFSGCTSLRLLSINGGTTSIGAGAFSGCTSLHSLCVPDTVQSIGDTFISGCLNLEEITLRHPAVITGNMMTIGAGSRLKKVTLGDGVVQVNGSAFTNGGTGFKELKKLEIARSVKSIGNEAFRGCGIEELTFEYYDRTIGSNAFAGPSLKKLTVKSGIIGDSAFANCTGLQDLTLGTGTAIGNSAFENCTSLDNPHMDGAVSVGSNAFKGCTGLKTLKFPDSITSYGDMLIEGCIGLEELEIGGGSSILTNVNSVSKKFFVGNGSALRSLKIHEGVTAIEEGVFANWWIDSWYGFPLLSEIVLPKSLTSIGHRSFYKAGNGTLRIEGDITSWGGEAFGGSGIKHLYVNGTIGESAFAGSTNLEDVHITGTGSIGNGAFSDCTALETVAMEEGLKKIGNNAFKGCSSLKALEFPNSVSFYGDKIIEGCIDLERLVIGGGCKVLTNIYSESRKFYVGSGTRLKHLEIRDGVTSIEENVFANCYINSWYGFPLLSDIILPKTLTSIGSRAFYKAGNGTLRIEGDITSWGSEAFGESGITHLYVNGSIGSSAFSNCRYLEDVHITGTGSVGSSAFAGCTALETVIMSEGLRSIGGSAFKGCTSLRSLIFPNSVTSYGDMMIEGCTGLEQLVIGGGCGTLPNVNSVSKKFFVGKDSGLKYLEIREGVTKIEEYVFANMSINTWYGFPDLSVIVLPESLVSVGYRAFYQAGVKKLIIKGDVIDWGSEAFANGKLETLEVYGNIGSSAFANCKALKSVLAGGTGTAIGSNAFSGCTALESVTLAEGVVSIGNSAFKGCSALGTLVFPDSVASYGDKIIEGCTGLEQLVIGGGCRILTNTGSESRKFYIGNGSGLKHLEIREGVTGIEDGVFANYSINSWYGFPQLSTIILPESLVSIGIKTFYKAGNGTLAIRGNITGWGSEAFGSSGIRHLYINGSIGGTAFANSKNLEDVHITGTGSIGSSAFSGCTALETVTIEEGLRSVGSYAFKGCTGLKALEFPDSVTSYGEHVIEGCTGLERLVIGGGCETLANSGSQSKIFYVGNGSGLKYLEIREGVKTIAEYVFSNYYISTWYGFPQLSTIILPESLTSVGYRAFYKAGNDRLTIGGNIVSWGSEAFGSSGIRHLYAGGNIGASAFANCKNLEDVYIRGNGSIGNNAFSGCTSLASVVMEEGVKSVGSNAFANCRTIQYLHFPDSVTSYGTNMINGCTGLRFLIIGGGCESLTYAPFQIGTGSALTYLQIGEGVTTLGDFTLANASSASASAARKHGNLGIVVLPRSLTSIGKGNLNMLPLLRLLICGSGITSIASGTAVDTASLDIYSDSFNGVLNSIAEGNEGVTYHFNGELPEFTLRAYANRGGELEEILDTQIPLFDPISLPDISDEDWMLKGWYTDEACTCPLTGNTMPGHDITVYAKMTPAVQIVWLTDAEETGTEPADEPGWYICRITRAAAGEEITAPSAWPPNRVFEGWYTDASLTTRWFSADRKAPAGGLTLYGHFAPLHDVHFMLVYPDGEVIPYATSSCSSGAEIILPEDPAADGYSLAGWYMEPELSHPWAYGRMTEDSLTLYGKMARVTAGGIYRETEDGLTLVNYVPEEDEGTEIYLPATVGGRTVTGIDAEAFRETEITLIHLPDGLKYVDAHAFDGAERLSILRISAANGFFAVKDGVLYNRNMTALIRYPEGKTTVDFTIPAGVTSMESGAFRGAKRLETVKIPSGITVIPAEAFSGCSALKTVSLPDTVSTLGVNAFNGCWSLTGFTAFGLTNIGENAIPANSGMTATGPVGEGALRSYCLDENAVPERFIIPYNPCTAVLNINGKETAALQTEKGVPVNTILIRALVEGFESLESVSTDSSLILELADDTVITGWYTDSACTIGWDPENDTPQGDITLYAKPIPRYTYETADFVTGKTTDGEGNETDLISKGIRLTGYYGRGGNVILPDAISGIPVMSLGAGMLSHANGAVLSIAVGPGVIEIENGALNDAEGNPFTGIILTDPESWAETWAAQQDSEHDDRQYTLSFVTGGASMKSVQAACGTVIRVGIPVRTGGEFLGWYLDDELSSPAGLENGVLFTMPGADTTLYAAWDMKGDTPEYTFTETAAGTITITGYTGNNKIIEIPEEINGLPVTALGERAFAALNLTRITLPDSVVKIGRYAFAGSTAATIHLGGTKEVGDYAFADCVRLQTITMNAAEKIGEGAFSDAATIPEIVLPDTLRSVGAYAFSGCGGLTSLSVPDGVAQLAAYTFSNCRSLKTVYLGSGLTTVEPGAFWQCPKLKEIIADPENAFLTTVDGILYSKGMTRLIAYPQDRAGTVFSLPVTVSEIAGGAFANAEELTEINLTENLQFIGEGAFRNVRSLTAFILPENCGVTDILKDTFLGCSSLTDVVLNDRIISIEDQAFGLCPSLKAMTISPATTQISSLAVGIADVLTIIGTTGSAADTFARTHNIRFFDPGAPEAAELFITGRKVMLRGETQSLELNILPEEAAACTEITWSSSNPSAIRVTDGYIQALSYGTGTVTAEARNGISAVLEIRVLPAVQRLEMITEPGTFARGEELRVICDIAPDSVTCGDLTWTSSDESVAAVDENGRILMTGEGEAVITAVSHNGMTASLAVQVYNPIEELIPASGEVEMTLLGGDAVYQADVEILPEDATYRKLIWESSDENVVTAENGILTAISAGSAVISVRSSDARAVSASISVMVEKFDIGAAEEPVITGGNVYTGEEQTPVVGLTIDGIRLEQDVDFIVTSGTVLNAGEYTAVLEGVGRCRGTITDAHFTVAKASPEIRWTGMTTVPRGSVLNMSDIDVSPSICPAAARLYRIVEDGSLIRIEDGRFARNGKYLVKIAVEETENWYSASAEQQIEAVGVSLSVSELTMAKGQSLKADAACSEAVSLTELRWMSSDEDVVKIHEDGTMTAAGAGTAVITLGDGTYSDTCTVTVIEKFRSVLSLPARMKVIGEAAFEGTEAQAVTLPAGVQTVMERAFAGSPELRQVIFEAGTAAVAADALEGSPLAVIVCAEDSETAGICREKGIRYVFRTEPDQ